MRKISISLIIIMIASQTFATKILFSDQIIFYGIGCDTFSGCWEVITSRNTFSGTEIGTFTPQTQLWILHHQFSIVMDPGDTAIAYRYRYRTYLPEYGESDWIDCSPTFYGQFIHDSGYHYALWSLDSLTLLNLPLDTGDYVLEFDFSASVRGPDGDTLTKTYATPDGAPFSAGFHVEDIRNPSTEEPLPVRLAYLDAAYRQRSVNLYWRTESETEASHFIIYRDGDLLGDISAGGTCLDPRDYAFTDRSPLSGIHEYCLAEVSYAGVKASLATVCINIPEEEEYNTSGPFCVFPNPFNHSMMVHYTLSVSGNVDLCLFGLNGKNIATLFSGRQSAGHHSLIWQAPDLAGGIYFLVMKGENYCYVKKILYLK